LQWVKKTPKGKEIILTKDNLQIIDEIRADFSNFDEIVGIAKKHEQMLSERNKEQDIEEEEKATEIPVL
jgi:hypothetical protein